MSTGTIYSEGVPDDLNATHIIAGTGGYYVGVPRLATSYMIAVGIILVVVFCFLLIAFAFYWSDFNATVEVVIPDLPNYQRAPVNLVPGRGVDQVIPYTNSFSGTSLTSQAACEADPNASWTTPGNVCRCVAPYWGGDCQRESYNPGYISSGVVVVPDQITLEGANTTTGVDYLSYPQAETDIACTQLCDQIGASCIGVIWDQPDKSCTTFTGATLAAGARPAFNPAVDSNLYLRNWQLGLTDEVLLFSGSRPTLDSWWQAGEGDGFKVATQGIRYRLDFFPEGVYSGPTPGTPMTGVYSRLPFPPSDWQTLAEAGSVEGVTYVIPAGQTPLLVPLEWGGEPIWVMYNYL